MRREKKRGAVAKKWRTKVERGSREELDETIPTPQNEGEMKGASRKKRGRKSRGDGGAEMMRREKRASG